MGGRGKGSATSRNSVNSSTKSVLGGAAWKNETLGEFADRMIRLDKWQMEKEGLQSVIRSHETKLRQAEGRLSTYMSRQGKLEGYANKVNEQDIKRETQKIWAEKKIIEKLSKG